MGKQKNLDMKKHRLLEAKQQTSNRSMREFEKTWGGHFECIECRR